MEKEIKQENNFLGTAPISKLLRMFSIPCVTSLVIQALYNLVDQIFIGHKASLGAYGNAATGIIYGLTVIALGLGLWLGDGAGSALALNQGKNDTTKASKIVGTSLITGLIISIIFTIVCFLFKTQILEGLGGYGHVLELSIEYSNFIFLGFTFYIIASILNPIIRSDGNPIYAMVCMAIGAVCNIILDPILLYGLNMGMDGAALATFIGQAVTFILSVLYLFKSKTFRLKLKDFIPSKDILIILKLGISSFITQFSIFLITLVNNKILVEISDKSGYSVSITQGAITLAFKVFGIIVSIGVGIACGGAPILGYNYGAKKYDRVKKTLKYILISTAIVGIIATILFEAAPNLFLLIFGDGGDSVDKVAYSNFVFKTFRIYLSLILPTVLIKVISIYFQATGSAFKSALVSVLRDVVFLIPLVLLLGLLGDVDLFLFSAPIADLLGFIVAIGLLIPAIKKLGKLKPIEGEEIDNNPYELKESKDGFIITIAREHGSRGKEIGKLLAQNLNIPYYDKELIALAEEESGLDKEFINEIGETSKLMIYDLYQSLNVIKVAVEAQEKAIKRIASFGSCVIVGRASDYVLRDNQKLIAIYLYANKDYKVKSIMERYNDSYDEALKQIKRSDDARSNYYKSISQLDWNDMHNYDICIDASLGVEKTVDTLINYIKNR